MMVWLWTQKQAGMGGNWVVDPLTEDAGEVKQDMSHR